jgi:hypothetical protein
MAHRLDLLAWLKSRGQSAPPARPPLEEYDVPPAAASGVLFDDLARALATGVSRRQILRQVGLVLAGGLFSSLGLQPAYGAGVNCALYCRRYSGVWYLRCLQACRVAVCRPFCSAFRKASDVQRCLSDAARGVGLCEACDGDLRRLCRTPSGGLICCAQPNACRNGQCVGSSSGRACGRTGAVCPSGTICAAVGLCCPSDLPVLCGRDCVPPGSRCCGAGYPSCPRGMKCCLGVCIAADSTCCPNGTICPPHLPICAPGACCADETLERCVGTTFRRVSALSV